MWAFGPEPSMGSDDFPVVTVPSGAVILFIEEHRNHSGTLDYVKVVYGEHIGYLPCNFLSVGSLLRPVEDAIADLRQSQAPGQMTASP